MYFQFHFSIKCDIIMCDYSEWIFTFLRMFSLKLHCALESSRLLPEHSVCLPNIYPRTEIISSTHLCERQDLLTLIFGSLFHCMKENKRNAREILVLQSKKEFLFFEMINLSHKVQKKEVTWVVSWCLTLWKTDSCTCPKAVNLLLTIGQRTSVPA